MTNLPPQPGDGSAATNAVPSQSPGSSDEPGRTAVAASVSPIAASEPIDDPAYEALLAAFEAEAARVRQGQAAAEPSAPPIDETPVFGAPGVPAPAFEAPAPVFETPAPVFEAATPVFDAPTPVFEAPASVFDAAPPVFDAPASAFEAPAPVFEAAEAPAAGFVPPVPTAQALMEPPAPAASAPAPAGVPVAVPYTWEAETRSRRLGAVAFVAGLVLFVVSLAVAVYNGVEFGRYIPLDGGDTSRVGEQLLADGRSDVLLAVLGHVALGTLIGIWVIVQSIVAIAQRRGRAFGVTALVLAATAPVLSYLAFSFVAGFSAAVGR